MPVVEITESTAAQSVLDHVVDHGEFPEEMEDDRPLVTVSQGLDEETFQTLKTALVNHPRLQNADSEALGASFAGSRASSCALRLGRRRRDRRPGGSTSAAVPFFRRCADKECRASC